MAIIDVAQKIQIEAKEGMCAAEQGTLIENKPEKDTLIENKPEGDV